MKSTNLILSALAAVALGVLASACQEKNVPTQEPDLPASESGTVIYFNNFDKEEALKDANGKWPFCDQSEIWKNQTGKGAENVTYEFSGNSIRTNVSSNSDASDYEGSGLNNLLFGSNSYLKILGINIAGDYSFTLSFGAYKYGGAFRTDEFPVAVSADGEKWIELNYSFKGEAPNGRWDVASTTFTVPKGTSEISLYFPAKISNSIRLDDVSLVVTDQKGTEINFSEGGEDNGNGAFTGEPEIPANATYFNDFDAERAYQSDNKWPYLDQTEIWKHEQGTGIATVTYDFASTSVRTTSVSSGNYSDYKGSGLNNLLLGTNAHFAIQDITLPAQTSYTLSFGTVKSEYGTDENTFKHEQFKVYISEDKEKWVEITYAFQGGKDLNGRWDKAISTFTLPVGTKKLSVYFLPTIASAYRLDDVALAPSTATGTAIDFSKGNAVGYDPTVPTTIKDATIAQILAEQSTDVLYRITGTVEGPIQATYGNYDVVQGNDRIYIYNTKNWSDYDVKVGGTITLYGQFQVYNEKPELKDVTIEAYTAPAVQPALDPITATVAQFLAAPASETQSYKLTGVIGGSINTTYGNFDLTDETGTVYVYGLTATNLGFGATNDKSYASLGLKEGDTVTLVGFRAVYNGKDEVVNAYYVSHVAGETPQVPDTPVEGKEISINVEANASAFQRVTDNETYGVGYKAVINGVEVGFYKNENNNDPVVPSTSIRVYDKSVLCIKASTKIRKVVLKCESGRCNDFYVLTDGEKKCTCDKTNLTISWVGEVDEFIARAGGQSRITDIILTVAE